MVHYLNPAYMNEKDLFNPNTVDSLVCATTPGPVLGGGDVADARAR